MRVRVPASSANLGPGFDALAVALNLYIEVSVEPAERFSITSEGFGAGVHDDDRHLGATVARSVLGHDHFAMHVKSAIPLSRGLGSSAALALGAAMIDGHAENAAASMIGGLVVGTVRQGDVVARRLELDPMWRFVVVVPAQELATPDARSVLPSVVPFHDAVFNLSSLALLISGLAHHELFEAAFMQDALHQPYRMELLKFARPLLQTLLDAGASGSCWSGAGSSMLGLCLEDRAEQVAHAARDFMSAESIDGRVLILEADRTGLVTL